MEGNVKPHDVVSCLAQAHSVVSFGQLLRADAKDDEKSLRKPLEKTACQVTTVQDNQDTTDAPEREQKYDNRDDTLPPFLNSYLKVVDMEVFGMQIRVLFYTGALLNITSKGIFRRLNLVQKEATRRITVADENTTCVIREVRGVATTFNQLTFLLSYLVLSGAPFAFIVSVPTMEAVGASIDLRCQMVTFPLEDGSARASLPLLNEEI